MDRSGRICGVQRSGGGVPKLAVASAELTTTGLAGDVQSNRKYHGGPERALCLFSAEVIAALQAQGHPISAGAAGENLTIAGLEWVALMPGTTLRVGAQAVIQIASYTTPCSKIAGCFQDRDPRRVSQDLHPGWSRLYARVLTVGTVAIGDAVTVVMD
ncbi:MAG: MOSC domain-containing protein [Planctomycetes bacterium]|nr:MOSC domain-containing protein [Planctomycetota bacterium]